MIEASLHAQFKPSFMLSWPHKSVNGHLKRRPLFIFRSWKNVNKPMNYTSDIMVTNLLIIHKSE